MLLPNILNHAKKSETIQPSIIQTIELPSYPNFDGGFTVFENSGSIFHIICLWHIIFMPPSIKCKESESKPQFNKNIFMIPGLDFRLSSRIIHDTCLA